MSRIRWFRFREIPWIVYHIAKRIVFCSIPFRVQVWVGRVISRARLRVHGAPKQVVDNMRSCEIGFDLDPAELEILARRHLVFRSSQYLSGILPTLPILRSPDRWPIEGREHLDSALRLGHGVLLAGSHFGLHKMIGPILRLHGYDVTRFIGRGHDHEEGLIQKRLDSASRLKRAVHDSTRIYARTQGPQDSSITLDLRPVFSALRKNQIVYFAGDGLKSTEFVSMPFLGRSGPFPTGFMKIAIRTGAPVLPVFAMEGGSGRQLTVEFEPPLRIGPQSSPEDAVRQFVIVLESRIRMAPHLWRWWWVPEVFERRQNWSQSPLRGRFLGLWTDHGVDLE